MTQTYETNAQIEQYQLLHQVLDERAWRLYLGTEAKKHGYGGIRAVARESGAHKNTVARGLADIAAERLEPGRIRVSGAGRKPLTETDLTLVSDLEKLLEPKGDPMSPIRWTTKSLAHLESALALDGHHISYRTVGRILKDQGFSLQANKKNIEGISHPDLDDQFKLLNATVKDFLGSGDPVISTDTKKKELIGNFKNNGRECSLQAVTRTLMSTTFHHWLTAMPIEKLRTYLAGNL